MLLVFFFFILTQKSEFAVEEQNASNAQTKGIDRIELYRKTHWTPKHGWTTEFAENQFVC